MLGIILAVALTSASPHAQGGPPGGAADRPVAAVRTVEVSTAQLAGQPVGAVRRQLQQFGLKVRVFRVRTDQQPAGTVVSVEPSGPVPIGSVVTVIAAATAHDGQGNGDGGQGNGGGGDGGGSGDGGGDGGGGGGGNGSGGGN